MIELFLALSLSSLSPEARAADVQEDTPLAARRAEPVEEAAPRLEALPLAPTYCLEARCARG